MSGTVTEIVRTRTTLLRISTINGTDVIDVPLGADNLIAHVRKCSLVRVSGSRRFGRDSALSPTRIDVIGTDARCAATELRNASIESQQEAFFEKVGPNFVGKWEFRNQVGEWQGVIFSRPRHSNYLPSNGRMTLRA